MSWYSKVFKKYLFKRKKTRDKFLKLLAKLKKKIIVIEPNANF